MMEATVAIREFARPQVLLRVARETLSLLLYRRMSCRVNAETISPLFPVASDMMERMFDKMPTTRPKIGTGF